MKAFYIISGVALAIYAAICVYFYIAQDGMLYAPTPDSSPPGANALRLERADATLKIWQLHPSERAALIYFGGNAEDVAGNLPDFDAAFPDRAIYLVNYRGYGGSSGVPSEGAFVADAEAVFDWVQARHDRIAVMGRSLGTGVATALAARRPVERVVLVTPFDSIAKVAVDHFPWLPVRWLVKDGYDSVERMPQVQAEVLVIIAERDEIVFRGRSDALIAAMAPKTRHVVVVPRATHNDISRFPEYQSALKEFLAVR